MKGIIIYGGIFAALVGVFLLGYSKEMERIEEQKQKEIEISIEKAKSEAPEVFNEYCNRELKTYLNVYSRMALCSCITREMLSTLGRDAFFETLRVSYPFSLRTFIENAPKNIRNDLITDINICEFSMAV